MNRPVDVDLIDSNLRCYPSSVSESSCVTEFSEIQLLGPGYQIKRNIKITAKTIDERFK